MQQGSVNDAAKTASAAVKEMLAAAQLPNGGGSDSESSLASLRDRRLDPGCYFDDGIRSVDYVLVWEEDLASAQTDSQLPAFRRRFEANLLKAGVEMEEECSVSEKKRLHFLKLFIPWDVMCYYAEALGMRAPLMVHPDSAQPWSAKLLSTLGLPNPMDQEMPGQPPDCYTCTFRKSKLSRFLGSENRAAFFAPTQRHQVAREVLLGQAYGTPDRAEVGIDRLLDEGAYTGAFPLHDGPFESPPFGSSFDPESLNSRQILQSYWASWGRWFKYQPLDHVREYYGEKIGIYFAWLGLYTAWLLPASLVGVAVFAYGCATMGSDIPAQEVCASGTDYRMCPLCAEALGCDYWHLSEACLYSRAASLFDHAGTVFFAVFVSLWAVTFLEMWKRKAASLAHHWDVADCTEDSLLERPRPEFAALCTESRVNPITGAAEPDLPVDLRLPRLLASVVCIVVMLTIVLIFIVAIVVHRLVASIPLFRDHQVYSHASLLANAFVAALNLLIIMCLDQAYQWLAIRLTKWEMHRTQSDFDRQLALKASVFQFVNYYSSVVHIAFFKANFAGIPGRYASFLGLADEDYGGGGGGCLVELALQLGVIMIGKQIVNNCEEIVAPKLATWLHRFRSGLNSATKRAAKSGISESSMISHTRHQTGRLTRCEADYGLIPYDGLMDEYLEMMLQFGFITLFVAAFPLAPVFALLNNWLEIRLDAGKLVRETRRPVSERAQGIGVWFTLLDAIVQLSVISNAFLIAFTSDFLPREVYRLTHDWELRGYVNFTLAWAPENATAQPCRYRAFRDPDGEHSLFYWRLLAARLAFVIVFEHAVFFASRLLDLAIPDVPEPLRIKAQRERYLARQALMDAEMELRHREVKQPPPSSETKVEAKKR